MVDGVAPNHKVRGSTWLVTRKYPPRIGGMERFSWELTTRIAKRRPVRIIALRAADFWLPFFLAKCTLSIIGGALTRKLVLLHLGDSVLAPLGSLAKRLGIPVCVTVHGRDATYANPFYKLWLRMFFRDLDAYVCVSDATRTAAIDAGAPAPRISVIGNGVTSVAPSNSVREADLLLFVGRLVRRKGLEWFVRVVLPRIARCRDGVRLAIIGAGPERSAIQVAAAGAGVAERIEWLGAVPDTERIAWLRRASVCIAPNVRVADDIEGYGIVALEAAAAGCALIASDLEGLRDAIVDEEGGRLVPSEDADAWTAAVIDLLDNPVRAAALGARARAWAHAERDWETVCDGYEEIFVKIAATAKQKPSIQS